MGCGVRLQPFSIHILLRGKIYGYCCLHSITIYLCIIYCSYTIVVRLFFPLLSPHFHWGHWPSLWSCTYCLIWCKHSIYLSLKIEHTKDRIGTGTPSTFALTCQWLGLAHENVEGWHYWDHAVLLLVCPWLPPVSGHLSHQTHHQNQYPSCHHHPVTWIHHSVHWFESQMFSFFFGYCLLAPHFLFCSFFSCLQSSFRLNYPMWMLPLTNSWPCLVSIITSSPSLPYMDLGPCHQVHCYV